MKITIEVKEELLETEINIKCSSITPEIERIITTLNLVDKKLIVKKDDSTFFLNKDEIFYIETVDKKTFVYTKVEIYETVLKLYELEKFGFFRASKSCIINLKHIKSLKAEFNSRIKITMANNEHIIVSRQYAEELEKLLGVK